MADYRSEFYSDGSMQIEPHYGPPSSTRSNDFRCHEDIYASSSSSYYAPPPPQPLVAAPQKLKKGKGTTGSPSYSWGFSDPEFQRKKRIASYGVYSVEGRVKGSFRKSMRWFKDRFTQVVHGWW